MENFLRYKLVAKQLHFLICVFVHMTVFISFKFLLYCCDPSYNFILCKTTDTDLASIF